MPRCKRMGIDFANISRRPSVVDDDGWRCSSPDGNSIDVCMFCQPCSILENPEEEHILSKQCLNIHCTVVFSGPFLENDPWLLTKYLMAISNDRKRERTRRQLSALAKDLSILKHRGTSPDEAGKNGDDDESAQAYRPFRSGRQSLNRRIECGDRVSSQPWLKAEQ